MALTLRWGTVNAVTQRLDDLIRCTVDGTECVAYPRQTGPVEVGDTVLVNTQARDLELGSGGFDVLYANMTRGLGLRTTTGRARDDAPVHARSGRGPVRRGARQAGRWARRDARRLLWAP